MFVCSDCKKPTDRLRSLVQSQGPCEICGKVTVCWDIDIHSGKKTKSKQYREEIELLVTHVAEFRNKHMQEIADRYGVDVEDVAIIFDEYAGTCPI